MSLSTSTIRCIFKRELCGYFATPVAYVFLVIYLILAGIFTWYLGGLYEQNQAELTPFFSFQPWLFLALVPALAMRLWAEERRGGTIELLLTLPIFLGWEVLRLGFACLRDPAILPAYLHAARLVPGALRKRRAIQRRARERRRTSGP